MGASTGRKFLLLFWKNWVIQKRKVCCTVVQIVVPIILSFILVGIRQAIQAKNVKDPVTYDEFIIDEIPSGLRPTNSDRWFLAYTPDNALTQSLMGHVADHLDLNVTDMGFSSESQMRKMLTQENDAAGNTLGGIVFKGLGDGTLPDKIKYKIRLSSLNQNCGQDDYCDTQDADQVEWETNRMVSEDIYIGPRGGEDEHEGGEPGYYKEGFLALQRAVDRAITIDQSGLTEAEVDEVGVLLQRHPYPPYLNDGFVVVIQGQFPLFLMIIYLCMAPCVTADIVMEKEKKLKETMKLMGMPGWLHWAAWFCKYLSFMMITVIIMTIFYSVDFGRGAVINKMDPSLLLVFLIVYTISVIMFCFAVSVFFSAANTAAAATFILFFLTYVPYFFFGFRYYTLSLGAKIGSSFLPNVAMAFSCTLIALQEAAGVGQQWDNFYKPVNVNDDLTLLYMILMLLCDSFICFVIVWYVEAIKPGDFGVPLPWYFPFTKWYWCGGQAPQDEEGDMQVNADPRQHEAIPDGVTSGVKIRGLRKVFNSMSKDPRIAVDSLDLDMVEGQITALLGHNGAGKTTTMFMLTGFLEPTQGNAIIGGYDIRGNLGKVRENLGLCPQHDVLFEVLTVREHLEFFGKLKGCEDVDKEVREMIELLHLVDKTDRQARTLSGGMRRKLCVGIALIGGSKVIILDEPTSGMDPEARRHTWDILQKARRGRTMLLTTHFMDEADYLGDRIAIMSHGKLVCSGSSLFLKKRYGVGYHMNMVKKDGCDSRRVEEIVKKYVPDAGLESDAGAELSFVLPHESSAKFEELFKTLESQKSQLGINSWGASVTTMEEVFLKVGEEGLKNEEDEDNEGVGDDALEKETKDKDKLHPDANKDKDPSSKDSRPLLSPTQPPPGHLPPLAEGNPQTNNSIHEHGKDEHKEDTPSDTAFTSELTLNTGYKLWLQQFWAMFFKRVLNSYRSPVVSVVQLSIPFIFALFGCIVEVTLPSTSGDPNQLALVFDKFNNPRAAYKGVGNEYATEINQLSNYYKDFLKDESVKVKQVSSGDDFDELEDYLVKEAKKDLQAYISDEVVAGYFQGNYTFTANLTDVNVPFLARGLFNNELLHSPAYSLTAVSNAVLRYLTGNDDKTIETVNHPLPLPPSFQADEDLDQAASVAFTIAFLIGFGMSFLVATFVVFVIKERFVKAKHCQYTSGVPVPLFWFGTYLWDIINFIIPCLLILILFAAFNIKGYVDGDNVGVTFLLFLFYGLSVLPFVYLISFAFDVAATGYVVVVVVNIITGTLASVAVFILKLIATKTTNRIVKVMEWIFYALLPNFCFANGLQEIYNNYNAKKTCDQNEDRIINQLEDLGFSGSQATFKYYCDEILDSVDLTNPCCPKTCGQTCTEYVSNDLAWKSPGVGRAILFMFIQTILYFAIIFFLESGLSKRIYNYCVSGFLQARMQVEPAGVPMQRPMTSAAPVAGAPLGVPTGSTVAVPPVKNSQVYGTGPVVVANDHGSPTKGVETDSVAGPANGVPSPPEYVPMAQLPAGQIMVQTLNMAEDDDVAKERQRIEASDISVTIQEESLVLRGLTKFYGGFKAVDNLSIGIKQGACFGLLGVNGAGKTTTFKMLTGDETVSGGKAFVKGYNVATQIKEVQRRVGYCPQFDALIDKLTVKETLTMYARLRGVKENQISEEVDKLIGKLLLKKYTNKLAGDLSGGNKRKLSTAIAMIGGPPIVFLDEPTTGMDPVARRQLWNTLVEAREAGRTIILTSHSMEECEALCTRLVIMVNGQFKCTGSSQHLKDKFGEGYALMAKVTPGEHQGETQQRTFALMNFVEQTFPGCVLKDSHPGLVLYQISSANTNLAQVFGIMERNKEAIFMEDYSVSQTTLEQVFINFARAQRPPLEESAGPCCPIFCCCH